MRLKLVSVVFPFLVAGFAWNAAAAPIELENDAEISWANRPDCSVAPALCEPLIIGAPRLVPDMRSAGDLLLFTLDFHDISLQRSNERASAVTLNIGDAAGNEVLRPDGTPLRLTYTIPGSSTEPGGFRLLPAPDLTANLGSFAGFGLLPAGDLIFTVTLTLRMDLPFGEIFPVIGCCGTRTEAATLSITGPGTPLSVVPEPSSIVLLLAGLAGAGLGARWRRPGDQGLHA